MSLSRSGTILLFDVPLLVALQYDQSLASTGGTLICPKTTKTLLEEDFLELHSLCTNLHKWVLHQWPWTLRFDDLKRCSPSFLHIREWTLEHCTYIDRATIFTILSMMPALDALRIAYFYNANEGPTPMMTFPRPACRLSRVELAYGGGLLPCQWLLCNSHNTLKRVSLCSAGAKAEDLLGALEQCKRIEHLSYAADSHDWIPMPPTIDACSRLTSLTIDVEIAVGQAGSLPRTLRELALTRRPMYVFITFEQCQAMVQDVLPRLPLLRQLALENLYFRSRPAYRSLRDECMERRIELVVPRSRPA
ncbi:hypothetical protein EXIGLDRAFT_405046 [Exidia glandulosa HHB12029]|uniref:F-box domain-containing protein n=1 Tax=Exidia glandulosa HHB12029 TaxID=1314781 RepID=A0A165KSM3_EXIGL|nr:hypothetical protein EXIGLDRAFT_405046 [Exidia glandulosa HHB12029]